METIKKAKNVEFDVIYDDGTVKHVPEGILFEADGDQMRIHCGTNRDEVIFTVSMALIGFIEANGRTKEFKEYLAKKIAEMKRTDHGENKE